MEKLKKIIILFNINNFNEYSKIDNSFYKGNTNNIIAYTIDLRIDLKQKNIFYNIPEEYLTINERKSIDKDAFNLVDSWHKDQFKFNDISLGILSEYELKFYFSRIIRNFKTFLNLIKKERPNIIISFESNEFYIQEINEILKYVCSINKINFNLISTKKNSNLNKLNKTKNFKLKLNKTLEFFQKIKVLKFCVKSFIKTLWFLKILKIKIFNKNLKYILTYQYGYHQNIIENISKNNNLILLDNKLTYLNFKQIIQNLKSIFINKKGGYHIFLNTFSSRKINSITRSFFKKSYSKWNKMLNNEFFQNYFSFEGICIWPIIKSKIYDTIFFDFKNSIKTILILKIILKKLNCNLIILSNDILNVSKALSIVASQMNIPTLVIQHGITGASIGYLRSSSKKIAVWGKISKEHMIKFGIDKNKMVITGCPRFDKYIYLNKNNLLKKKIKKLVFKDFNIDKNKKLIILANPFGFFFNRLTDGMQDFSEIEATYDIVLNAVKNIPNSHLIIKFHIGDNNEQIPKMLIKILNLDNVSIIRNYEISNLIVACDCFITGDSTTAIEAMLMKKPVICLFYRGTEYTTPYFEYDAVYKASDCKELVDKINKSINQHNNLKNNEHFLKDYLYKTDGKATKRILKLIEELTIHSNNNSIN